MFSSLFFSSLLFSSLCLRDQQRGYWNHVPEGCSYNPGNKHCYWNAKKDPTSVDANSYKAVDAVTGYDTRSAAAGSLIKVGWGWLTGTWSRVGNGMYYTQARCGYGNYCTGGVKKSCPAGMVGSTTIDILDTADCAGKCPAGFCCVEGSAAGSGCGSSGCVRINSLLKESFSWFQSNNAAPTWVSTTGSHTAIVTAGTVEVVTESGNGASSDVTYLKGDFNAKYNFGSILPPEYSICTLSRYTGANNKFGRIFADYRGNGYSGNGKNWLHGHHGGCRGRSHYETWFSNTGCANPKTDWLVMCGTNIGGVNPATGEYTPLAFRDGEDYTYNRYTLAYKTPGYFNTPSKYTALQPCINCFNSEYSDWGVAEVITWARPLKADEFLEASRYLMGILKGEDPIEWTPLPGSRYVLKRRQNRLQPDLETLHTVNLRPQILYNMNLSH